VSTELQGLRNQLLDLVNEHAVVRGDFVLTSGKKSNYYVDGKLLSLMPEGLNLLSRTILEMIKNDKVDAVGGLTLGADPIIGGVVTTSHTLGRPVKGLIIRKEQSSHGREKLIEGPLEAGMNVVVIEDVVTTGSSSQKAIAALEKADCKIVKVIAVVDRLAGGRELFESRGYKFEPIFTLNDLTI